MKMQRQEGAYSYEIYEDGNTVRRIEIVPDYHEERRRRKEERRISEEKRRRRRAARRNRERAMAMSMGYVSFLAVCVFVVALTSACVIHLQTDITIRQKSIAALESRISELQTDNDIKYKRIATNVDLDKVRTQAEKLGMRYPTCRQVVYYTVDNLDYMTQYSNITDD